MQHPDSKEIEILSFRQTTKGRLSPAFLYLKKMNNTSLLSIPKLNPNFDMYITYVNNMETVYIAIFHKTAHTRNKIDFFKSVEVKEFNLPKKISIIYCGKGDKRMLIFAISTLRETGIQIKQHEYSAITFDENML